MLDGGEWITSRPGRFTPGNEPKYPFNRRLGGRQSRSGRFGEEKTLLRLSHSNPGPHHNRCTEYDVQTSLIDGSFSEGSACIIRDSNPATLHHGCEAFPGWSAAARFGVHQYVCQRDLVTIRNEPATPICELTAPAGLSEPQDAGKDNPGNES